MSSRLQDVILYGLRADQPDAADVSTGALYYVTDELVTERSNGATWDDFSDSGTVAAGSITNAKLADVPTDTFKGRTTVGTGAPEDLTVTQATELINNMVGDSGAGGTKGLVPAPASGDAAANKFLKADGTWQAVAASSVRAVGVTIDGSGSVIATGVKGYIQVPYNATITKVTMLADQSGSIVVDIWKDTYANYPPVNADSITAAAPPTISGATKSEDSTLTGWTTSITAGDVLGFNVDSATTITRLTLQLELTA
jgi:hypothetical protein